MVIGVFCRTGIREAQPARSAILFLAMAPKTGGKRVPAKTPSVADSGNKRRKRQVSKAPPLSAPVMAASASGAAGSASDRFASDACMLCNETDTSKLVGTCASPCCKECLERYTKGFTVYGSLPDFADRLSSDDGVQAHWKMAEQISKQTELANWFPTTVGSSQMVEVDIERSLIGMDRAQIMQACDGVPPESMGVKLETLRGERGQSFKGLLVVNPMEPYVKYTYRMRSQVNLSQVAMASDKQLFAEQGQLTYDYKKERMEEEDATLGHIATKMKTLPYTVDTLKGRVAAHKKKQELQDKQAAVASSSQAADGQPTDDVQAGPSMDPPLMTGPVLNMQAYKDSMTVVDGEFPGKTKSPGTKMKRSKPESLAEVDEGMATVNRRVLALCLGRIFKGDALGRELRWARDTLEELGEDDRLAKAKLERHIETAKAAMVLTENSVLKLDASELKRALDTIVCGSVDLPTTMKVDLWTRRCKLLMASRKPEDFKTLLNISAPWPKAHRTDADDGGQGAGDDDDIGFDPRSPELNFIESSVAERFVRFQSAIFESCRRSTIPARRSPS